MFKLVLEKPEEPEIKLPTSVGSSKRQESSRKTSATAKLLQVVPDSVLPHRWQLTRLPRPWDFFGRTDAKVDSLEKTLMLAGIGGRRRRG